MKNVLEKGCGDGEAGVGGIFHPLALQNEKCMQVIFHISTQSGSRVMRHPRAQGRVLTIYGIMQRKSTLNASWCVPTPELLREDKPPLPPLLIDKASPTTLRGSLNPFFQRQAAWEICLLPAQTEHVMFQWKSVVIVVKGTLLKQYLTKVL